MIVTEFVKYRGRLVRVSELKPQSEMIVEVQCDVCGNTRTAIYKSVRRNQTCHRCAINKCKCVHIEYGTKYNRLTVIEHYKHDIFKCVCNCGTIVFTRSSNLKSGHTKSCGCLQKEAAVMNGESTIRSWIGENHPSWKGGISSERRRFNASIEAKKWRMLVFERDGFKCKICGKVGGELNAHHIKQYAFHPELRLDIDNGITLCKECHILIHKIIGKKKHTTQ